jgi:hypothetical protein
MKSSIVAGTAVLWTRQDREELPHFPMFVDKWTNSIFLFIIEPCIEGRVRESNKR